MMIIDDEAVVPAGTVFLTKDGALVMLARVGDMLQFINLSIGESWNHGSYWWFITNIDVIYTQEFYHLRAKCIPDDLKYIGLFSEIMVDISKALGDKALLNILNKMR